MREKKRLKIKRKKSATMIDNEENQQKYKKMNMK